MAVMLSEEILVANTANVNNCHCEEFEPALSEVERDVAIGVQVAITYRAGQFSPCRRRRCPYHFDEDCHAWPELAEWVVELQPLLVLAGLMGGVFVLLQMVLTTFEPRKRWKQFRHKEEKE